jgi:uncharacterized protein YciI
MRQQDLRDHAAISRAAARRRPELRAAAAMSAMDGGLAIVRAATCAEARAMLAADPAIVNGVFVAELRQWRRASTASAPNGCRHAR